MRCAADAVREGIYWTEGILPSNILPPQGETLKEDERKN